MLDGHIRRLLFEGREATEVVSQASSSEPVDVPLVTPIQVAPAPVAKDKKIIPVLQVADVPAENPPLERVEAQPSSENIVSTEPVTKDAEAEPLSMIERAVASSTQPFTQPFPTQAPAPEPVTDAAPEDAAEMPAPDEEDRFRRTVSDSTESGSGSDESIEYEGEVEIIIDPEQPPGRKHRGRQGIHRDTDDSLYDIDPFAFDGMPSRPPSRLQRLFSGRTLLVVMVLAALGFAAFKGGQFYFSKGLAVQTTFPETGEIYQSIVVPGHIVSRHVLASEAQREIEVHVDAADNSSRILVGQAVLITSDAFPGLEWQETVIRLGAVTEQEANTNPVKVFISLGAQAPDLHLGQAVDAEIRTAWNPHAIKVPFEALLNREGQMYLAVLQDGQVRMKPVITGIEDFAMAEIRQGLGGREKIILPRGLFLRDGDRVYQTS